jgi:hypothetical protein
MDKPGPRALRVPLTNTLPKPVDHCLNLALADRAGDEEGEHVYILTSGSLCMTGI